MHRPPQERAPAARRPRTRRAGTGRAPKRRMVTHGPSIASGGITAWRREPSGRRASTIGDARSRRRPSGPTTRSTSRTIAVGVEVERDRLEPPVALDVGAAGAVDHHLGDRRIGEQWLERTEPRRPRRRARSTQPLEVRSGQERVLVARAAAPSRARSADRVAAGVVGVGGDEPAVHPLLQARVGVGATGSSPASGATVMPRRRRRSRTRSARRRASRQRARARRAAATRSTPASTARATVSRTGTRASTGRPSTSAISRGSSDRPGSSTSTAPMRAARDAATRTARRSAR